MSLREPAQPKTVQELVNSNRSILDRVDNIPTVTYSPHTREGNVQLVVKNLEDPKAVHAQLLQAQQLTEQMRDLGIPAMTVEEQMLSQLKIPNSFSWNNYEEFLAKIRSPEYTGTLRAFNFEFLLSPVVDQLNCGSCWAIAPTTMLADRISVRSGRANILLSSTATMACAPAPSDGCVGGVLVDAMQYIANVGIPRASCLTYEWCENDPQCSSHCDLAATTCHLQQNKNIPPCNPEQQLKCNNGGALYRFDPNTIHHIGVGPENIILESIKYSIYQYGPVVSTYLVYMDFIIGSAAEAQDVQTNGTSTIRGSVVSPGAGTETPWPETNGIYIHKAYGTKTQSGEDAASVVSGAHSVVVVGWGVGDAGETYGEVEYWIVRNSWSRKWGNDGYFKIAFTNRAKLINYEVYLDVPTQFDGQDFGGCLAAQIMPALQYFDPYDNPTQYKNIQQFIEAPDRATAYTWLVLLLAILFGLVAVAFFVATAVYRTRLHRLGVLSGVVVGLLVLAAAIYFAVRFYNDRQCSRDLLSKQRVPYKEGGLQRIQHVSSIQSRVYSLYSIMPFILNNFEHSLDYYRTIVPQIWEIYTKSAPDKNEPLALLYFGLGKENVFLAVGDCRDEHSNTCVLTEQKRDSSFFASIVDPVIWDDSETRSFNVSETGEMGNEIIRSPRDFIVADRPWYQRGLDIGTGWTKPYEFSRTTERFIGITYVIKYTNPKFECVVAGDASESFLSDITGDELQLLLTYPQPIVVLFSPSSEKLLSVWNTVRRQYDIDQALFFHVDTDSDPQIGNAFRISEEQLPAVVIFHGGKPVSNILTLGEVDELFTQKDLEAYLAKNLPEQESG